MDFSWAVSVGRANPILPSGFVRVHSTGEVNESAKPSHHEPQQREKRRRKQENPEQN
jgi:hypothetical protein